MSDSIQVSGAILAGGESRRMGQDKAMVHLDGQSLLQHAIDALSPVTDDLIIISGHEAHDVGDLERIPDEVESCGPAGGILTALNRSSREWTLILSCDTPRVQSETLNQLIQAIEGSNHDALILESAGQIMPLIGLYHRRCLPVFQRAISNGNYRVQSILSELDHGIHVLPEVKRPEALNINTLEDLRNAQRSS